MREDVKILINKLVAAHKTLENAKVFGGTTRTAGLHPQRCSEIMDAITGAIVELGDLATPPQGEKG